jgi:hypothetical protein
MTTTVPLAKQVVATEQDKPVFTRAGDSEESLTTPREDGAFCKAGDTIAGNKRQSEASERSGERYAPPSGRHAVKYD